MSEQTVAIDNARQEIAAAEYGIEQLFRQLKQLFKQLMDAKEQLRIATTEGMAICLHTYPDGRRCGMDRHNQVHSSPDILPGRLPAGRHLFKSSQAEQGGGVSGSVTGSSTLPPPPYASEDPNCKKCDLSRTAYDHTHPRLTPPSEYPNLPGYDGQTNRYYHKFVPKTAYGSSPQNLNKSLGRCGLRFTPPSGSLAGHVVTCCIDGDQNDGHVHRVQEGGHTDGTEWSYVFEFEEVAPPSATAIGDGDPNPWNDQEECSSKCPVCGGRGADEADTACPACGEGR